MNILIYTSKSTYTERKVGGAETSLRLLAESLAAIGHHVTYATTSYSFIRGYASEEVAGVRVLYLPSFRGVLGGKLPLWISSRLDAIFGRMSTIERIVNLATVDIVFVFYQPRGMRFFVTRKERYGYSVIVRMAGLDWYEDAKANVTRRALYERLFSSVDSINFTSEGLRRLCEQRAHELGIHWQLRDWFVQDIGVHRSTGQILWKGSDNSSRLSAITATRFSSYQKRHDLLVRAVALLHGRELLHPDNFFLRLVGDGNERERVERLIADLGIQHLCRVEGFLPQSQLWDLLPVSDLLCHPCDYEGLSKIVAESMMVGLPVLASRVVPLTDEIVDGQTGFLADNTAEAWAEKLHYLLRNPNERAQVSHPAREYAKTQYDPKRNSVRYIEHFARIRNEKKHA